MGKIGKNGKMSVNALLKQVKRVTAVFLSAAMVLSNVGVSGFGTITSMAGSDPVYGQWSGESLLKETGESEIYDAVKQYYSGSKISLKPSETEIWQPGASGDFRDNDGIQFETNDSDYTDDHKSADVKIYITPKDADTKIDHVRVAGYFGSDGYATPADAEEASLSNASVSNAGLKTWIFKTKVTWNDPVFIIYYRTPIGDDAAGNPVYPDKNAYTVWVEEDPYVDAITPAADPNAKPNALVFDDTALPIGNIVELYDDYTAYAAGNKTALETLITADVKDNLGNSVSGITIDTSALKTLFENRTLMADDVAHIKDSIYSGYAEGLSEDSSFEDLINAYAKAIAAAPDKEEDIYSVFFYSFITRTNPLNRRKRVSNKVTVDLSKTFDGIAGAVTATRYLSFGNFKAYQVLSKQLNGNNLTVSWLAPGATEGVDIDTYTTPQPVTWGKDYKLRVNSTFSGADDPTKTRTVKITVPYGYRIVEITGTTDNCGGQAVPGGDGVTYIKTTGTQAAVTDSVTLTARDGSAFAPQIAHSSIKDHSGIVTYTFHGTTSTVIMDVTIKPDPNEADVTPTGSSLTTTVQASPVTTAGSTGNCPDIAVQMTSGTDVLNDALSTIALGNKFSLMNNGGGAGNSSVGGYFVKATDSNGLSIYVTNAGSTAPCSWLGYDRPIIPLAADDQYVHVVYTIPAGIYFTYAVAGMVSAVKTSDGTPVPVAAHYVTTEETRITCSYPFKELNRYYNYFFNYSPQLSKDYYTDDITDGSGKTNHAAVRVEAFYKPYGEPQGTQYVYNINYVTIYANPQVIKLVARNLLMASYDYNAEYNQNLGQNVLLGGIYLNNGGNIDSNPQHVKVQFDSNLGVKYLRLPGLLQNDGGASNIKGIIRTASGGTRNFTVANGIAVLTPSNLSLLQGEYIDSVEYDVNTVKRGTDVPYTGNWNEVFDAGYSGTYVGVVLNGSTAAVASLTSTDSVTGAVVKGSCTSVAGSINNGNGNAYTATGQSYYPGETINITANIQAASYNGGLYMSNYAGGITPTLVNPCFYLRIPYLDATGHHLFALDTTTMTGSSQVGSCKYNVTAAGTQTEADGITYKYYKAVPDISAKTVAWFASLNTIGSDRGTMNFNLNAFTDNPGKTNYKIEDMLFLDQPELTGYVGNNPVTDPTGQQTGHKVMPIIGQILMTPLPELVVTSGIRPVENGAGVGTFTSWAGNYGDVVQIPYNHQSEIQLKYSNTSENDFAKGSLIYLPIPHRNQTYSNYFTSTNIAEKTQVFANFDSELDLQLTKGIILPKFNAEYAVSVQPTSSRWVDSPITWTPVNANWMTEAQVNSANAWKDVVMVRFISTEAIPHGDEESTTFIVNMNSDAASGDQAYVRTVSKGVLTEGTNDGAWSIGGIMAVEAQTSTLDGYVYDDTNGNGRFDSTENKNTTDVTLSISGTIKEKNADGYPAGYDPNDTTKASWTGTTTNTTTDASFGPTAITISTDGTYYINDPDCPLPATGNIKYLPVGTYTLTATNGSTTEIYTKTGTSAITRVNSSSTSVNATAGNGVTFLKGLPGTWKSDVTKDATDDTKATYTFTVTRGTTSNNIAGIGLVPKCVITYKTAGHGTINGGTTPVTENTIAGATPAAIPATAADAGYEIDKWVSDVDVTLTDGTTIPAGDPIKPSQVSMILVPGDITLTVSFKPKTDTRYTVIHYQENLNDSGFTPMATDSNAGITDTPATWTLQQWNGFTYDGTLTAWTDTENPRPVSQTTAAAAVTGDGSLVVNLYYKRNLYTVTYKDGKSGSVWSDEAIGSLKFGTTTPTCSRSLGVYTDSAGKKWSFTGWTPSIAATVTEDATYTAQWVELPDENEYWTVTYQKGAHGTFADDVHGNIPQTGTEVTPAYSGAKGIDGNPAGDPAYKFMGWQPAVAQYVTEDATYVAQWEPVTGGHKATFDANGGTLSNATLGAMEDTNADGYFEDVYKILMTGETFHFTGSVQNAGKQFMGWNEAPDGSGTAHPMSDIMTMGNEDITWYAIWNEAPDTYTVQYLQGIEGDFPTEVYGGLLLNSLTPAFRGTLKSIDDTKYYFTGWKRASDGVIASASDATVTKNETYIAQWAERPPIYYPVSFDTNGGTPVTIADITEPEGEVIKSDRLFPADPARTGYTFLGWEIESDGGTGKLSIGSYLTGTDRMPAGHVKLKAIWSPVAVTLDLTADPPVKKVVTNGSSDKNLSSREFKFTMTADPLTAPMPADAVSGVKTITHKGDGSITEFGIISYSADDNGKTFTYKLTEENPKIADYIYDQKSYTMKVTIRYNADRTKLEATKKFYDAGGMEIADADFVTFTNTYDPSGPGPNGPDGPGPGPGGPGTVSTTTAAPSTETAAPGPSEEDDLGNPGIYLNPDGTPRGNVLFGGILPKTGEEKRRAAIILILITLACGTVVLQALLRSRKKKDE
jgi:pilin isopeptide linkage protein/uncharacterized repeat protein (TIGR02543 family)